ncbi:hypothetical protein [Pseudoxanthomonas sp. JBR18]|uniref:hypothetical protein n=1 Tax=Pseudoxanthomonas sp. JBR18 TaxID=2969308 RepID=UPI002304F0BF|nr:hypothetical protein [Pseudoxanthomonas sp. JBR18]WCE04003.1 hypothetical protein PJ250_18310 [Pseudoxanthomonas sp. JBR18]
MASIRTLKWAGFTAMAAGLVALAAATLFGIHPYLLYTLAIVLLGGGRVALARGLRRALRRPE